MIPALPRPQDAWRSFAMVHAGKGHASDALSPSWVVSLVQAQLGARPHPGTLNLRLPCPIPPLPGRLSGDELLALADGPLHPAVCHGLTWGLARVNDQIPALAIRPEAAGYEPNFIEIISPVHLRRALGLRDWDLVELQLELDATWRETRR